MIKSINPINNYDYIPPQELNVLVISKPFDVEWLEVFLKVLCYLQQQGVAIFSNQVSFNTTSDQKLIAQLSDKSLIEKLDRDQVKIYSEDECKISRVITLGGDGTILYAIKMFYNRKMPPIISFGLGSVGFLCCFDSLNIENVLYHCLIRKRSGKSPLPKLTSNGDPDDKDRYYHPYLQYRARLKIVADPHWHRGTITATSTIFPTGEKELPWGSVLNALNELTLEAGWFNSMFTVELYINDYFLTTVTAAGLIFSTPTGSTAYNMSAGGSIVQTEVKAIWVTPLNPSTLSFRPLILPFDCKITIKVPEGEMYNPFNGCIDGDFKFVLKEGDQLSVIGSEFPVPFVTNEWDDRIQSWIKRLKSTVLNY